MDARRFLSISLVALVALAACKSEAPAASSTVPTAGDDGGRARDDGDVPSSPEGGPPACPSVGAAQRAGALGAPEVDEASGIVHSTRNAGVYWVHNDSGDSARAFALSASGELLATLVFDTAQPIDIEDMAIEDDSSGESYLYFADIGDNAAARPGLVIHRVAEPKLDGTTSIAATSAKMRVTHGDGPHDAETLLFDPTTKDLLIVTKTAGTATVHRVGPFVPNGDATTAALASIDVVLATAGEISRDGRFIGVRNYGRAFLWTRSAGEPLAAALARPPCDLPLATERQGESFAFLADGSGYVTVSEGSGSALHVSQFE